MQNSAFRKSSPAALSPSELAGSFAGALLQAPVTLFGYMVSWQQQAEERARMRKLPEHQLRDVGLSRAEVDTMLRKPVWSRFN